MNPARSGIGLLLVLIGPWLAGGAGPDAIRQGLGLAESLRAQRPIENLTLSGTFKIRDARATRREIPVRMMVSVTPTNWQAVHQIFEAEGQPGPWLRILRHDTDPNQYEVGHGPQPPDVSVPLGTKGRRLDAAEYMSPFGGTDFWIADLGLEFLFWPQQRLLKKEMIRGQFCHVLESVNLSPPAGGYARVVAWIDTDTQGIVYAEAYDLQGRRLKEFAPKRFSKVDGQWQVREIEIRNLRSGSRTRLEFTLENNP